MANNLFEGLTPKEIKPLLDANADSNEIGTYSRVLDEDEMREAKERFAKGSGQYAKWAEELQLVKDSYKQKMKPLGEEISGDLRTIRHGSVECEGKIYTFMNYEGKRVERYDEDGCFIDSRTMRPEERDGQNTLQNSIRVVKGGLNEGRNSSEEYRKTGSAD